MTTFQLTTELYDFGIMGARKMGSARVPTQTPTFYLSPPPSSEHQVDLAPFLDNNQLKNHQIITENLLIYWIYILGNCTDEKV